MVEGLRFLRETLAAVAGLLLGLAVALLPLTLVRPVKPQAFGGGVEGLKAAPQIQPPPAPLPPTSMLPTLILIVALGVAAGTICFLIFKWRLRMAK